LEGQKEQESAAESPRKQKHLGNSTTAQTRIGHMTRCCGI